MVRVVNVIFLSHKFKKYIKFRYVETENYQISNFLFTFVNMITVIILKIIPLINL